MSADVVPFKATVFAGGDRDRLPPNLNVNLREFLDDQFYGTSHTIHGWVYDLENGCADIGKKKKLGGIPLIKGKKRVVYINEDEYVAGNGETTTFCADKKQDLQDFLDDWGFTDAIEDDEVVQTFDY
jgi:hypothetical protein